MTNLDVPHSFAGSLKQAVFVGQLGAAKERQINVLSESHDRAHLLFAHKARIAPLQNQLKLRRRLVYQPAQRQRRFLLRRREFLKIVVGGLHCKTLEHKGSARVR
jgi:hypothetical protein